MMRPGGHTTTRERRKGGLFNHAAARRERGEAARASSCVRGVAWLVCAASLGGCFGVKTAELVSLSQAVLESDVPRLSVTIKNYCLDPGQSLKDFFILNATTRTTASGLQSIDLDADGIPNAADFGGDLGLLPQNVDSDGDGIRDLPLHAVGISFSGQGRALYQSLLSLCQTPLADSDGDGLSDCEEKSITLTRSDRFDSDGDGIPDELELRFGLNPLDPSDAVLSPGADRLSNLEKVKFNVEIAQTAAQGLKSYFPKYEVRPEVSEDGRSCFTLEVSGMPAPIVPTGSLVLIHAIRNVAGSALMDRCCVRVFDPDPTETRVSLTWDAARRSPELVCPCPLNLVASPAYRGTVSLSDAASAPTGGSP